MLKDLFVCGSSHASGVGKGKVSHDANKTNLKSWVNFISDKGNFANTWNISLPGRPLGLTNADTAEFLRSYYKRYNTYDNLFVILEYTFPTYRQWDPVALARNDTKQIDVIPVSYYRFFKNNEHLTNSIRIGDQQDETMYIEQKYFRRTDLDFIDHDNDSHEGIYEEIDINDINQHHLNLHNQKVENWFQYDAVNELGKKIYSDEKVSGFLKYATDEVVFMQRYLEAYNIPYLMFWAAGQSDRFSRHIDRSFSKLIKTKRMIPMTEFTAVKAAQEWSIKHWRSHPDQQGHEKMSEYLLEWILTNKLDVRTQQGIYTDFTK